MTLMEFGSLPRISCEEVTQYSRVDAEYVLLGLDWGRGLHGGKDGLDGAGLAVVRGGGGRLLRRRVELRVQVGGAGARLEEGRKAIN